MESARGRLEEVVFETPDPPQRAALPGSASKVALPGSPTKASTQEGLDTSALPAQEALSKFAAKEAAQAAAANGRTAAKPRRGYEVAPAGFEPPEQRLARLQAEVTDLLRLAEASAEKDAAVAELLGGDPGEMSQELKVLEKRLVALSEESAPWRGGGKKARGGYAMPASLVSQLDRLASGQASAPASEAPGQVTYQINYAPNAASIGEGAKLAAMESTISEIEKQLGVREPISHFPDLQTAVTQLQKRLALLDSPKLEAIAKGVDKVAKEVEQVLAKKAQLEGTTDKDLDHKVSQLYDFCHRWSATAASLPQIVARLQSLQALHLQSASFASRLASLEKQQEELAKLLETTTEAVEDLNTGLKENMSIVRDNMKSLEAKIQQAVSG
ncbi:dctn2-b [Symbiodinium sp. CCMP2456]|nr:dctn2-b [Symbiodinium sp. CCMP2456]